MRPNLPLAVIFMLIVTVAYAALAAFSKVAQAQGLTAYQVVFFQNLFCLLVIVPVVVVRRGWGGFGTGRLGLNLVRDLAGAIGFLLFTLALSHISLTDALLLNNTGPLFLPLVIWVWMRRKMNPKLWWGMALGFIGVVLILRPSLAGISPYMILALASGLAMAIVLLSIRLLNQTEGPYVILFYYFLVSSIILAPPTFVLWQPVSAEGWLLLMLVGVSLLLLQVFLVMALQRGMAAVLSPMLYLVIVWSVIIDWAVWDLPPLWTSIVGALLVIVGGVLSILLGQGTIPGAAPQTKLPPKSHHR